MRFPEKVRRKALEASAFQCCLCNIEFAMHVHHINSSLGEDEGLHDFENAAPLCANCHDAYGENPKKRKFIVGRRDLLYENVKEFSGKEQRKRYEHLTNEVKDIKSGLDLLTDISKEIKIALDKGDKEGISEGIKSLTATAIVTASTSYGGGYLICDRCRTENSVMNNFCEKCNHWFG